MGLTSIVGKSGSGKSTIMNMIAKLDKPTEGKIIFKGDDIAKITSSKTINFRKKSIGVLFQSYNLIETSTALFNVMLNNQISGVNKKKSEENAKKILNYVGIKDELFYKLASELSGGEKQRVALARLLVNEPDVIICDEPTGALDSVNSERVMSILKKYSEKRLVIIVSHNLLLVEKYSDRIIEIKEGKLLKDRRINSSKIASIETKGKVGKSSSWINKLTLSNLKRRFKRNLFSFFALSTSLVSAFIAIGFVFGKDDSINKACQKQLDFASGTISKQEEISKGSLLSLSRSTRPVYDNLIKNDVISDNFEICLNFDAVFSQNQLLSYDELKLDNIMLSPVYNFDKKHVDHSLLTNGKMPKSDLLTDVVINEKCYEYLKEKINKDPLNEYIDLKIQNESIYVDFDDTYINDYFLFDSKLKIVGVVKELDYLNEPKIYYSYQSLNEFMMNYIIPNLSTYFNKDITWFDRIKDADNFDYLTSYSYYLFPKTYQIDDIDVIGQITGYSFSSTSLLIKSSLLNFMEVAKYGIFLFLGITVLGTFLIMGIMAFTSYAEDHKTSAILSCLGATSSEISEIYLNESLLTGFISVIVSLISSYFLSIGINSLIKRFVGLDNLINIPLLSLFNIPFIFPLISILISLVICLIVTIIPILFSKKISLKEELQSL